MQFTNRNNPHCVRVLMPDGSGFDLDATEEAARAAGAHVLSSPFVFVTVEGKPFRPDSISQPFKRAAKRAGLPDMRLHDLRHTGITYMLASGADPKTVSGFVGHATAQFTLNQYAHVMEQTKQRAGLLLENAVLPMGERGGILK